MNLTLKQKLQIIYGLLILGIIPMLLSAGEDTPNGALIAIGGAAILAAVLLEFLWHRCPHCGGSFGRSLFPKFCPHCGEKIDYNAKNP